MMGGGAPTPSSAVLIGLIVIGAIAILTLAMRVSRALVAETVRDVADPYPSPSRSPRSAGDPPSAMPGAS
jgi:hypothetical protein